MVNVLNERHFKLLERYLQVYRLEISTVPKDKRELVETQLQTEFPDYKIDWESGAGIIILSDSNFIGKTWDWAEEFNSFDIQITG